MEILSSVLMIAVLASIFVAIPTVAALMLSSRITHEDDPEILIDVDMADSYMTRKTAEIR